MSEFDEAVRDEIVNSGIRAEVFKVIYGMLERDAARYRDNGDVPTADIFELVLAKAKGLERNWKVSAAER